MSADPTIGNYSKVISSGVSAQLAWKRGLIVRAKTEHRQAILNRQLMREEIRALESTGEFDWLEETTNVEKVRQRKKTTRKRVEVAESVMVDRLRAAWGC